MDILENFIKYKIISSDSNLNDLEQILDNRDELLKLIYSLLNIGSTFTSSKDFLISYGFCSENEVKQFLKSNHESEIFIKVLIRIFQRLDFHQSEVLNKDINFYTYEKQTNEYQFDKSLNSKKLQWLQNKNPNSKLPINLNVENSNEDINSSISEPLDLSWDVKIELTNLDKQELNKLDKFTPKENEKKPIGSVPQTNFKAFEELCDIIKPKKYANIENDSIQNSFISLMETQLLGFVENFQV